MKESLLSQVQALSLLQNLVPQLVVTVVGIVVDMVVEGGEVAEGGEEEEEAEGAEAVVVVEGVE